MTGKKIIALKKWPYDEEKKKFEKNDNKKNTIYFKGKGRDSSLVYKTNILLVYFIKQNTTCFCRIFSV